MTWQPITRPPGLLAPGPITLRVQTIPARHYFPDHSHPWNQLVYAVSGVLTITTGAESFVITPDQAVWLPTGTRHRVGALHGAEFRSLRVADAGVGLPSTPGVIRVTHLLQALIVEAAQIDGQADTDGYADRVTALILDQLVRAHPLPGALPWPRHDALIRLCEALYLDPADNRSPQEWAQKLGMSPRTLARRFAAELGMSLRSWRRRLRLLRSVELLGGGLGVTQVAMALGYGSTSAFIYAFRKEMGSSPQAYMRKRAR